MTGKIRGGLRWLKSKFQSDPDKFLSKASGVIHVGANVGQERELYAQHGLRVVWIEPIPETFQTLQANIRNYPQQAAVHCLVTDKDDAEYQFHISNNDGLSSSILDLKDHQDIWPEVNFKQTITLRSATLETLVQREQINTTQYNTLIMDTQGAEMLVLKGAVSLLPHFRFVKAEVPDFEAYVDCCQVNDLAQFMTEQGYREYSRSRFAKRADGGSYYDIVYERIAK